MYNERITREAIKESYSIHITCTYNAFDCGSFVLLIISSKLKNWSTEVQRCWSKKIMNHMYDVEALMNCRRLQNEKSQKKLNNLCRSHVKLKRSKGS